MKLYQFILLALQAYALNACVSYSGHTTVANYAQIADPPIKEYAENVYLFMDGEEIDFKYIKLGVIDVSGSQGAKLDQVLQNVKSHAWAHYANAVIVVKTDRVTRIKTTDNIDDKYDKQENYSSLHATGVAVQIEIDSAFVAKYGPAQDSVWIKKKIAKEDALKQTAENPDFGKKKKKPVIVSVLRGIGLVAFLGGAILLKIYTVDE